METTEAASKDSPRVAWYECDGCGADFPIGLYDREANDPPLHIAHVEQGGKCGNGEFKRWGSSLEESVLNKALSNGEEKS